MSTRMLAGFLLGFLLFSNGAGIAAGAEKKTTAKKQAVATPQTSIEIVSPARQSTAPPGGTVVVKVEVHNPQSASFLVTPWGGKDFVGSEFETEVTIPATAAEGSYTITAATGSGKKTISDQVTINIGMPSEVKLVSVTVHPSTLQLALGQRQKDASVYQLVVVGTYSDGKTEDLTRDPATKYTSSNPAVAVVNATGIVSALASGSATVTVTHKKTWRQKIPVIVS